MAKKKTIEDKMVDVANELFDEGFKIYSNNLSTDGSLPDGVEILTKQIEITRKHLEQLVFLLKKYNADKK